MSTSEKNADLFENIALIMIAGGFVLHFLKVESSFWWITIGFLMVGIVSLIREIRIKSAFNLLRVVRIVLPLLVIALVLKGLLYGGMGLFFILIVLIMYTFVKRMASN